VRILIVFFSAWMASAAFAQEAQQEAQQAPQIQTQPQPERSEPAERTPPAPQLPAGPAAGERTCPPERACEPSPRGAEGTEFWPPILGYRLRITDTLIAGVMALLFWATWLLWLATRRLVQDANLNAERQLRAYLAIVPKTIGGFRPNTIGTIEWVMKNMGQTPAQKIRHRFDIAVLPNPLPARHKFPNPTREISHGALLPKDETATYFGGDAAFTAQQIEAVSRNEARVHCWGYTEYEDIFRLRWRIRLSVSVGGEAFTRAINLPDDHPSAPRWSWEYGNGHNEIERGR
jgi:hypothetical protein